jgi:very-short-patch-repair endonuclease
MAAKRLDLDDEYLVQLYLAGKTVEEVATKFGVSRPTIARRLLRAEVPIRSYAEGARGRYEKTTRTDRLELTRAAHDAARGREKTHAEQVKRARSREARPPAMSVSEAKFAAWLDERRVTYRREVAVDKYNVDFALGPVAVEILGGEWHGTRAKTRTHSQRTPNILNAGWAMLFIWAAPNWPMTPAAADYAITFLQAVRSNPSLIGEYRVIRGDAQLLARARAEDYDRTRIPTARKRPRSDG